MNHKCKNPLSFVQVLSPLVALLSASTGALAQSAETPTYYGEALDALGKSAIDIDALQSRGRMCTNDGVLRVGELLVEVIDGFRAGASFFKRPSEIGKVVDCDPAFDTLLGLVIQTIVRWASDIFGMICQYLRRSNHAVILW